MRVSVTLPRMESLQEQRKTKWRKFAVITFWVVATYVLIFFLLFKVEHPLGHRDITLCRIRPQLAEHIHSEALSSSLYAVYFPMREWLGSYPVNLYNSRDRRYEHINQQRLKQYR
ncbi:hypothetical protein SAMN02745181_0418 [Rubritalea squalenifaciens DSM 18772]|uniref:Uncharacterized protein n=1 Tax=Rubritalea squalenifaciens DSM 18772 TaxID=1123071 RepID=A0A1M6C8J0_9BACT|nr:hypothetical protein [Rubritalea squalenifaciens]SHI57350.1 hypothetical protein SAMN02745181_0418 [Rubritalea squalenifaciens DSM 18772]